MSAIIPEPAPKPRDSAAFAVGKVVSAVVVYSVIIGWIAFVWSAAVWAARRVFGW